MAGTTPIHKFPYPTGTDRVADGDNAIEALARAIEGSLPLVLRIGKLYVATSATGDGPIHFDTPFPTAFVGIVLTDIGDPATSGAAVFKCLPAFSTRTDAAIRVYDMAGNAVPNYGFTLAYIAFGT